MENIRIKNLKNKVWFLSCPSWSSLHRISWEFPTEQASNPITASERNKTICLDFLHLCRQELSEGRVKREGNCASGLMKGRGGAGLIFNIPNSTQTWKLSAFCVYVYKTAERHALMRMLIFTWSPGTCRNTCRATNTLHTMWPPSVQ